MDWDGERWERQGGRVAHFVVSEIAGISFAGVLAAEAGSELVALSARVGDTSSSSNFSLGRSAKSVEHRSAKSTRTLHCGLRRGLGLGRQALEGIR